jgi:hypothetical protein
MAWSAREARGHFARINTVNECESKVHRVCRVVRSFRVTGKGVADCEVSLMHRCRYSRWRTRTVLQSHLIYDNQNHRRRRLRMRPGIAAYRVDGALCSPSSCHYTHNVKTEECTTRHRRDNRACQLHFFFFFFFFLLEAEAFAPPAGAAVNAGSIVAGDTLAAASASFLCNLGDGATTVSHRRGGVTGRR